MVETGSTAAFVRAGLERQRKRNSPHTAWKREDFEKQTTQPLTCLSTYGKTMSAISIISRWS